MRRFGSVASLFTREGSVYWKNLVIFAWYFRKPPSWAMLTGSLMTVVLHQELPRPNRQAQQGHIPLVDSLNVETCQRLLLLMEAPGMTNLTCTESRDHRQTDILTTRHRFTAVQLVMAMVFMRTIRLIEPLLEDEMAWNLRQDLCRTSQTRLTILSGHAAVHLILLVSGWWIETVSIALDLLLLAPHITVLLGAHSVAHDTNSKCSCISFANVANNDIASLDNVHKSDVAVVQNPFSTRLPFLFPPGCVNVFKSKEIC